MRYWRCRIAYGVDYPLGEASMQEKMPVVVEVKWRDSWSNSTSRWTVDELRKEPDLVLMYTGYLIHRDKRGIDLASQYRAADKSCRHVHHIPQANILKVRKLK